MPCGQIHYNFISLWQLRMLTGQADKMFIDLTNSKGSRELSAVWKENIVSGVNQECFESCVFTLYVGVLGQVTRYSDNTAPLLPQLTLRQP